MGGKSKISPYFLQHMTLSTVSCPHRKGLLGKMVFSEINVFFLNCVLEVFVTLPVKFQELAWCSWKRGGWPGSSRAGFGEGGAFGCKKLSGERGREETWSGPAVGSGAQWVVVQAVEEVV